MYALRLISTLCVLFVVQVKCQYEGYFLPKNVIPSRYIITIIPHNLTNYKGNVEIELTAVEDSSNITLHIDDIFIDPDNVKIIDENATEVKWNNTSTDEEKNFYIIDLNDKLLEGKTYNLTISEFVGSLTETKFGFFLAKYPDLNDTEHYFSLTEFEPTYARKAFPCFDEPNLKAKFIIKIIRLPWYSTASNTPLQETIDLEDGTYLDIFKETPLMPTYLVAFILSDFKYTKQNDIIRILVQPEHINDGSTDFILEESVKILRVLEEYTGMKYPLDKLDLVAVPKNYFVDGAMENWGLITYSDKYLICPKNYSHSKIQDCLTYTAHEFAHQWFGNLATPKTWQYIWLSEGFASYFQYYIANIVKPTWRIQEQYFLEEYEVSLKLDTLLNEAIEFQFKYPDAFPNANIYYRKASAIIRMTEHILTDEIHRNGLRIYLENNKFKNTEPIDVFNAYEQALKNANATHLLGNFTIHEMLSTWNKNPSYPLVTVQRDYETGKVTFSQKLFNFDEEEGTTFTWYIPITYALESTCNFEITTTDVWLTKENVTIDIYITDDWILVNKNATGYYRVTYDETNWQRITTFLKTKDYTKIPPINRAQLLYDAFYLTTNNQLNYEIFFNLTLYLEQEIDYIPIKAFLDIVGEVDMWKVSENNFNVSKKYVIKLLDGIKSYLRKNKKENDSHTDRLSRNLVESLMCKIDEEDCVREALQKFVEWKTTGKLNTGDGLNKNWLCAVMRTSSASSWNFLLKNYYLTKSDNTRTTYIYALTCNKNPLIMQRFIKEIFDLNNTMPAKDGGVALSQILESEFGINLFIEHIQTIDVDKRYCTYFSEVENIFVPAPKYQLQNMKTILAKTKDCIPVTFYKQEDNNFIEELNKWINKYFD